MFARTYAPSKAPEAVQAWRGELEAKKRTKLAAAVADPSANPELFEEGWEEALQREGSAPGSDIVGFKVVDDVEKGIETFLKGKG